MIKPAARVVADLGHFQTARRWFADPNNPVHRAPSVMTYARETNQVLLQVGRMWVAVLCDEVGAGFLAGCDHEAMGAA